MLRKITSQFAMLVFALSIAAFGNSCNSSAYKQKAVVTYQLDIKLENLDDLHTIVEQEFTRGGFTLQKYGIVNPGWDNYHVTSSNSQIIIQLLKKQKLLHIKLLPAKRNVDTQKIDRQIKALQKPWKHLIKVTSLKSKLELVATILGTVKNKIIYDFLLCGQKES